MSFRWTSYRKSLRRLLLRDGVAKTTKNQIMLRANLARVAKRTKEQEIEMRMLDQREIQAVLERLVAAGKEVKP